RPRGARAPRPGLAGDLEVAVPGGCPGRRPGRALRNGGPPEARVEDHSRRVDDAGQPRGRPRSQARGPGDELIGTGRPRAALARRPGSDRSRASTEGILRIAPCLAALTTP